MDHGTNNPQRASQDRYGVYLPHGQCRPIVVVPLCMRPSLEVEKRYGPCGFIGTIVPDGAELSRWMRECASEPPSMELLVTGEDDILSVRDRAHNAASPEDGLLALPG